MKKVAVVIPKYGLAGGAEQFAQILTNSLIARTGYHYHVFANRYRAEENNVVFHHLPLLTFPKFLTTVSFAYFAAKQINQNNYSLVHSHERIFFADIFTMHGIPHRYWVENIRRKRISLFDMTTDWVERRLVLKGNCRKFVAVSRLTKEIFLSSYDVSEEKIAVIHPGVDLPDLTGREEERCRMRRELGIPLDVPVMIFVSMNFEIKGLAESIEALAELKKQKQNLKLIVVGKGNINKFRKAATQAGVGQDVVFTGAVNKDKLMKLYLSSDFLIMLSRFDTFGMVVLEAMTAGLPAIISNNVGAMDIIREGENGFVVAKFSDIVSRIKTLLAENTRAVMKENARQTAKGCSWDEAAKKYAALYEEILADKVKNGIPGQSPVSNKVTP